MPQVVSLIPSSEEKLERISTRNKGSGERRSGWKSREHRSNYYFDIIISELISLLSNTLLVVNFVNYFRQLGGFSTKRRNTMVKFMRGRSFCTTGSVRDFDIERCKKRVSIRTCDPKHQGQDYVNVSKRTL